MFDAAHPARSTVPSPAVLGLHDPRAAEDLGTIGWDTPDSIDVLWALSNTSNPDQALNVVRRLHESLTTWDEQEPDGWDELNTAVHGDVALRIRFLALCGGSRALGDFLAAHPHSWRELDLPLPTAAELMHEMLACIQARPAAFSDPGLDAADTATERLDTAGTYRAGISGPEAIRAVKERYTTLIMRIAAYDLAGTFPETKRHQGGNAVGIRTITALLSHAADAALTAALAVAITNVLPTRAGEDGQPELPLLDDALAIIAMGKCGAQELNYISDVDVIFVGTDASPTITRIAAEFSRVATRAFFEVDANLRPEGKSGALVRTVESHVAYYKKWAHTWEFQALLKARPMTGHLPLGQEYYQALNPMVWNARRRPSFVEDVQAMRRRVLANVPERDRQRELKLGKGGLRDIEFAIQLLQLVHGSTDEVLRTPATLEALDALISGGYVGREDGAALSNAYEFLRLVEHRLQLQRLRRTHMLPEQEDRQAWEWLAAACGFTAQKSRTDVQQLRETIRRVQLHVSELHSSLFYRPLLKTVASLDTTATGLSSESMETQLAALGYKHPARAVQHLHALAAGTSRKAKIQAMLLPTLMNWLGNTADPDAGLLNYRKLSEAAYEESWFLRLLRDEGVAGQRLMHILGTSPYASGLIIAAPDVVKQLGDGAQGPKLLETSSKLVGHALVNSARRHRDPDKAIAVARGLRRAELARIASADLLGTREVTQVCLGLSTVWAAVLHAALMAEYDARTPEGGVAPAHIAVIGMGRLGGFELGYGSDADVMFVAEPTVENPSEEDTHAALVWATEVVDSMRSRLSRPSQDPPLEVDVGLRPEGRSGAMVRTVASYVRYYTQWGEPWEKQALLRAHAIAGSEELGQQFIEAIDPIRYTEGGASDHDVTEVRRMKARVDNERLPRGADRNTHTKLGRGGLTDIEWTVQLLTMMHGHTHPNLRTPSTVEALHVIRDEEIIAPSEAQTLLDAWLTATHARNALVLVRGKRTDQLPSPGPALALVAAASGWAPEEYQEFLEHYLKITRRARKVVDKVFWGETEYDTRP